MIEFITDFTEQVKERNMAELFENFVDDIGLIPIIKYAREKYAKGRAKGLAEGRAEGLSEGESRFAKLTQLLLESGRTDDLTRAVTDLKYRKELYLQYNL